jgi:hypothetical protein
MNFSSGFFILKNLKLASEFFKIKKTRLSVAHQGLYLQERSFRDAGLAF